MRHRVDSVKYGAKLQALVYDIFPPTTAIIFFLIQFLSKWTYIHTPGIHTNVKLIYADYAMVLQKTTQETKEKTNNNNKKQKTHKQNRKKEEGQKYIRKAKGRHTFTRTTATAIIS